MVGRDHRAVTMRCAAAMAMAAEENVVKKSQLTWNACHARAFPVTTPTMKIAKPTTASSKLAVREPLRNRPRDERDDFFTRRNVRFVPAHLRSPCARRARSRLASNPEPVVRVVSGAALRAPSIVCICAAVYGTGRVGPSVVAPGNAAPVSPGTRERSRRDARTRTALQRPDVVHDVPAILLLDAVVRRHVAAAVANHAEEVAIRATASRARRERERKHAVLGRACHRRRRSCRDRPRS